MTVADPQDTPETSRAITRDPRIVTGTDEEPLEFGDDDVWNLEPPFEEDE